MRNLVSVMVVIGMLSWSTLADARSFRPNQVPSNPFSSQDPCLLCHVGMGGGPRKAFGQDVENTLVGSPISQADVDWQAVCPLDSDNDGYTNGEELGDPNCNWMVGDPQLNFDATDPSDPNDPSCGNNVASGPEVCDGTDLKNTSCSDLGAGTGTPTCNNSCSGFLTTTCSPPMDSGLDAGLDAGDTAVDSGTPDDTGLDDDIGLDTMSDVASMDVASDTDMPIDASRDVADDTSPTDVSGDTPSGDDASEHTDVTETMPDAQPDASQPADSGSEDGGSSTESGCGCRSQPAGSSSIWFCLLALSVFIRRIVRAPVEAQSSKREM